jgi:hypothetical protein
VVKLIKNGAPNTVKNGVLGAITNVLVAIKRNTRLKSKSRRILKPVKNSANNILSVSVFETIKVSDAYSPAPKRKFPLEKKIFFPTVFDFTPKFEEIVSPTHFAIPPTLLNIGIFPAASF